MPHSRKRGVLIRGDAAPSFSVRDAEDRPVSLQDHAGSYLLIVFLRYAGCPWCNLALHRLAMETSLLRSNNCDIIAFIQSERRNIVSNIYERHARRPEFPLIPDKMMHVYDRYGVQLSLSRTARHLVAVQHWVHAVREHGLRQGNVDGSLFLAPAMFLVSPQEQRVLRADYNANLYEHETFTRLYDDISYDTLHPI